MSKKPTYIITDLILNNTAYAEHETILLMSAEHIDLIEAIAQVVKEVHVFDVSYRALNRMQEHVRAENVVFQMGVYPEPGQTYDTAHVLVPKGRDFGRAQLWAAANALKPDGDLYITGATKGGAKTLIKDAETLFGSCATVAYKKSHRIAVSKRPQRMAYPTDWGDDPTKIRQRTFNTPLGEINVATLPGVFSWEELDDGTAYLLEHMQASAGSTVLDVGCGVGVIGALAAKRAKHVVMTDDNLLAVRCAQATAAHNHLENVSVLASDVYTAVDDQYFDHIVSNPPFHQKFDVNMQIAERIIEEAADHLTPNGELWIVCNAFLKYETLFQAHFHEFGIVAQNSRFKVLRGIRS